MGVGDAGVDLHRRTGDGKDVPFHRRKGTKGRWGTFDVPQTPDDRLLRGLRPPGRGGHTPRGREIFFSNLLPSKYEFRALRRLRSR